MRRMAQAASLKPFLIGGFEMEWSEMQVRVVGKERFYSLRKRVKNGSLVVATAQLPQDSSKEEREAVIAKLTSGYPIRRAAA